MNIYKDIFQALICDPRYLKNLDWGKPRKGHPEGSVRHHIDELEQNLAVWQSSLEENSYWKLKILIHVHDSFKAESQKGVPISDPHSHASLARQFLEDHCQDHDLLQMIQLHDEPYALWRQNQSKGQVNQQRVRHLMASVADWDVFLKFLFIDGTTAGKDAEPLDWVVQTLAPLRGLKAQAQRDLSRLREARMCRPA
jgi:hypothetical protein